MLIFTPYVDLDLKNSVLLIQKLSTNFGFLLRAFFSAQSDFLLDSVYSFAG